MVLDYQDCKICHQSCKMRHKHNHFPCYSLISVIKKPIICFAKCLLKFAETFKVESPPGNQGITPARETGRLPSLSSHLPVPIPQLYAKICSRPADLVSLSTLPPTPRKLSISHIFSSYPSICLSCQHTRHSLEIHCPFRLGNEVGNRYASSCPPISVFQVHLQTCNRRPIGICLLSSPFPGESTNTGSKPRFPPSLDLLIAPNTSSPSPFLS